MSLNCQYCSSTNIEPSTRIRYRHYCRDCGRFFGLEDPTPPQDTSGPVSVKHDSDKPAVQYIPMEALFAMGDAFGYGARKYGGYNFQLTGLEVTRCLAAAVRHIFQFLSGEDNDKESGKSHLGHAMAAIGMAVYTLHHFKNKDDRFKSGDIK